MTASPNKSLHVPPHLPFDLVEDILCRLPVKHLRQLCCVSKSWNSLISHDSKFAKKHLRFSTFSHNRHHLGLHNKLEFLLWKSPISSFFISEVIPTDHFTQLSHPLINQDGLGYDRVSTCDGMFCFTIDESLALLCNPSIRKFNPLPRLKKRYFTTTYTLVYDRFIDNYKIISISLFCRRKKKNKKEVNIYTLGTDDWRKIQDFPYHYRLDMQEAGIFVSDTVYWLVYDTHSSSSVIVSLDLENESYQPLLLPFSDESSFPTYNSLGALRDCLCIFSHSGEFSDIWITKEYRNQKFWTKYLKVPYIGDPDRYMDTEPLYIYEDGKVLMKFVKMNRFILAICDSKNNTFKTLQIQNNIYTGAITKVYVESLISPFPQS